MMTSSTRDSWDRRIDRTTQLAERDEAARPLLLFYGEVLELQQACYRRLQRGRVSGSLDVDLATVGRCAPTFLNAIARIGPAPLAKEAQWILNLGEAAVPAMLLEGWRTPS